MKTLKILFFLFPIIIFAQPMQTEWENTIGGNGDEKFHDMVEATNGHLLAVGESNSNGIGGKDGYAVIYDFMGTEVMEPKHLGGKKDDVLKSAVQTYDGQFLMVGYTQSKGEGKSDGWLIRINMDGSGFEDQTFGGDGNDQLEDLAVLQDGSVVMVGQKDDGKSGDIWLIKMSGSEKVWEKNIGNSTYENVNSIAKTEDGGMVICGDSKSRKGDIFLLKLNNNGDEIWKKTFGEKGWEQSTAAITTQDGGVAISGWTRSKGNGGMDAWLLKVDQDGYKQWDKTYGGRDDDEAFALVEGSNQDLYLLGRTKSHTPGARQHNIYMVQTDAAGVMKREVNNFGGKKEECGRAIVQVHDGSLAWLADTESEGNGGTDGWLMKFNSGDVGFYDGARGINMVGATNLTLNTHDGKLKQGDRTFLSFELTNNENIDLKDIQIRVKAKSRAKGVNVWERNFVGNLQGKETKSIQIPVKAGDDLETGDNEYELAVFSGDKPLETINVNIESKVAKPATLNATELAFTKNNLSNENVSVDVRNGGDFTSNPVAITFRVPDGIKPLGKQTFELGEISAGQTKTVDFNFQVTDGFKGEKPSVTYIITEGGAEKIRKTVVPGEGGGADFLIAWIGDYDEAEMDIREIRVDKPFIDGKVKVFSKSPLKREDFRLIKNAVSLDGSKAGQSMLSEPQTEGKLITQNFQQRIDLEEGENKIRIQVETPYGAYESKEMTVFYDPQRPNLHLLTIGVEHKDLKYTGKDATDIAEAFTRQKGRLFKDIYVTNLTGETETTKAKIVRTLAKFRNRYTKPESTIKINKRDIMVVFISSHGSVVGSEENKRFRIRPSDFDVEIPEESSIDYKSEVLAKLDVIDCKKLVMIDACHSGGAKGILSEALVRINQAAAGLSTMTSCQAGELSYEDDIWKNGAFTEALLDALENVEYQDENGSYFPDTNKDKMLTLTELYDYLRRRVPQLVKAKTAANTTQIPFMPASQLDAEMPIFVWE